MKSSHPSSFSLFAGGSCLLLVLLSAGAPQAQAQTILVVSADPPSTTQGTVNLNVLIRGEGFEKGAISRFFVTGTTNPGGITVKTTTFFSSTELVVNIDVAGGATIADFDIEVQNTNGRTGKGIELLAVLAQGSEPSIPGYVGFVQQDYPTGAEPAAVVAADFNGDDVLDLATVNKTDNSLSVLLGNGDGTFREKRDFATDTRPRGVVAADFNRDGRTDLATANHAEVANTVSILLGNGDGTFGARKDFPTSTGPLSIVVGDFNGDGKPDVATINLTAESVSVLLGNGDGTFATKLDFPIASGPRSLTAVDFNRDGKLDLATGGTSTASVLLGQGNGTFNSRTDLSTDTKPVAVIATDFDNDGKPDLATANNSYRNVGCRPFCGPAGPIILPNRLSVRFGNGDGTFGNPLFFSLDRRGPREAAVAAGDFNADGRIDLAITGPPSNLVTVLLQAPALSLNRTSLLFSNFQAVGTPSTPIDLTISSTGSFPAVFGTAAISGADAGDFSIIADNCSGATVPAGNSCVVSMLFTPSSLGAKTASLSIPNNASGNPHVVNLRGSGVPNAPVANLSQTGLNVGDALVGNSLTARATLLQNIGGATLNVSSIAIASSNVGDFRLSANSTCTLSGAFTLAPGAVCDIFITFTPSAVGSRTANIAITTDAAGSPHTVALSGDGVSLNITPDSPSRTVGAGQPAIFGLQFSAGNAAATLTLSCSHSIPAASCAVSPNSLSLPGSATVTVMTTARGSSPPLSSQRRLPPAAQPEVYVWVVAWLAFALTLFLVGWRRVLRLRLSAAGVAVLLLAALGSGCGGNTPTTPLRGTPAGTYQVTVSASAGPGTQTQSIQLTVTVQ